MSSTADEQHSLDVAGVLKPSLLGPALPGKGAPYSGALALI